MFWKVAIRCTDQLLPAHRDTLRVGRFAKIQRAEALGNSKSREHTAKGLMTIHTHRDGGQATLWMLPARMAGPSGTGSLKIALDAVAKETNPP